jgi:hypothetical protein
MIPVLLFLTTAASAPAFGANSCVDCHQLPETAAAFPAWRQDQFAHWYGSVHGRKGVTCEKCHGGNPARGSKWLAHWGVREAMDPRSPTHYKNVPETCGTCHVSVYQRFTGTPHYKNLKADRLAPTCTTCHGFEMDVASVAPLQIARNCAMCHNADQRAKPEVASAAQQAVEGVAAAEDAIRRAQVAVDLAKQRGAEPAQAEKLLSTARNRLQATGELWHSFRLSDFKQQLAGIEELALAAAADAGPGIPQK